MSWHDTRNINESEEDRALRFELRDLLGLDPGAAEPSSAGDAVDMASLAQALHREAIRRGRVGTAEAAKTRPFFMRSAFTRLAAAAVLVAAVGSLGAWGIGQKHRADALAAKTIELEQRQNRMDKAKDAAKDTGDAELLQASDQPTPEPDKHRNTPKGELVKPAEKPTRLDNTNEQYRVRGNR